MPSSALPRGLHAVLVTSGHLRHLDPHIQLPPLLLVNSLIAAFSRAALPRLAVPLLRRLLAGSYPLRPDAFTFPPLVRAAPSPASAAQIHACTLRLGLLHPNVFVSGSLVHAYLRFGQFAAAYRVFDEMPERDVAAWNAMVSGLCRLGMLEEARRVFDAMALRDLVTWNSIISGYEQGGKVATAVELFRGMRNTGVSPDVLTLVSLASADSHLGALQQGMRMHALAVKTGLYLDLYIGTCLIDLYAKCGKLTEATLLFEQMDRRTAGPWNAIIAGLGVHGHGVKALSLFSQMRQEGIKPDHVTFVSLLAACSHAGLVDQGQSFFDMMQTAYGILPIAKHYACMVDMLGRAGQLDEAFKFIQGMPIKPDSAVWGALLGACRIHGNVEMGKVASQNPFELDPENVGYYVLMSNMYAKVGKWDGVDEVRSLVRQQNLQKTPGWSSIEVKRAVTVFYSGTQTETHPQNEDIQMELRHLLAKMKSLGYVPDYSFVLQDVEEDEKEQILNNHSERLAIAYGIISTPPRSPLNIYKNLRVCGDCHNATKYISKITEREIIVRDSNRFHHFKDGKCSCGDFW
ncbi:hypothetical protein PR202_gb20126 [Eleusine coracana subsp. coracana]|uniref:DYW domain-containing protein n=1 Tax=Eleusine coracana subsp. coracana TaxID=191504 RepID=A0AAV5FA09_ELECO|nr:hypothetical protein PR202_gb20126 [Eleusine coracana subsp. coracana]